MEIANLSHKLEMARLAAQSSQPGSWIAEDHAAAFPESPPRASSRGPVDAIAKIISGILSPTPSPHGERDPPTRSNSAPAIRRAGNHATEGNMGKASSSSLGTKLETIVGSPASSRSTQGGSPPDRLIPNPSPGSPAHASGVGARGSSELRAHAWKSPPRLLSPPQSPSTGAISKALPSSSPGRARRCGSPTNLPEEGDVFPEMCSILPDGRERAERCGSPTNLPEEGDVFPETCSILPDDLTPACNGTRGGSAEAGKSMAVCTPMVMQSSDAGCDSRLPVKSISGISSNISDAISGTCEAGEEAGSEDWGVNTI
jgi:hypothetical protein